MRLRLQFVNRDTIPWWGLTVLGCMLVVITVVANSWFTLHLGIEADTEQVIQIQEKIKTQKRIQLQSQNTKSPAEIQRIKEHAKITHALNYSWNQVFADIEQTQENGVAILAFSHDQSTGVSLLTLEALETPAIIRYVKKLNGDGVEGRWYISNYQVQLQNTPQTVKASVISK